MMRTTATDYDSMIVGPMTACPAASNAIVRFG
jgi:hypothetical protein